MNRLNPVMLQKIAHIFQDVIPSITLITFYLPLDCPQQYVISNECVRVY